MFRNQLESVDSKTVCKLFRLIGQIVSGYHTRAILANHHFGTVPPVPAN
jgi:hypothetical protein